MGVPAFTSNAPLGNQLFSQSAGTSPTFPFITVYANRDPTSNDANYPIKMRWINFQNNPTPPAPREWILQSFSNVTGPTLANWILIASGGSAAIEDVMVDVAVAPGVNPVQPNITNVIDFGQSFATHTPINTGTNAAGYQTVTRALNEYGVELQLAGSNASSSTPNNFGIAQFDANQFTVTSGFVQIKGGTTPAILTLSDNAGTKVQPDGTGNIQLEGQLNEQSGSFATTVSNAASHLIKINPMSPARWIVDPLSTTPNPNGTHTTINGAVTSALSGDTIILMPGTYTEDLDLTSTGFNKSGLNFVGFTGDQQNPNVKWVGKISANIAGTVSFSNIYHQTNNNNVLAVTGSAATVIKFNNCFLNCSNNTGISFGSSSASSQIQFLNCNGDLGTTGIAVYSSSSAGTLQFTNTSFSNSGASTIANTISAGNLNVIGGAFFNTTTSSGTAAIQASGCLFQGQGNQTAMTVGGSGTAVSNGCQFVSGSASALTVNSSMNLNAPTAITSTNANPITGVGTLTYNQVNYSVGNSGTFNTSTIHSLHNVFGSYQASFQPSFLAVLGTSDTNATGDTTNYQVGSGHALTIKTNQVPTGLSGGITTGGTFTAPIAGNYLLGMKYTVSNLAAGHTASAITIATTADSYRLVSDNPFATQNTVGSLQGYTASIIAPMAAGDTATFNIIIAGSTKTVTINGTSGGTEFTYIYGSLLN